MLKAGLFEQFKGATTLLLWGDEQGMQTLLDRLSDVRTGKTVESLISEGKTRLTISHAEGDTKVSELNVRGSDGLCWRCSDETLQLAEGLVEPLLTQTGHQFLDVDGQAAQVIIARDEYPADLAA